MTGPRTEYEAELLDLARRRTAAEEEIARHLDAVVRWVISLTAVLVVLYTLYTLGA